MPRAVRAMACLCIMLAAFVVAWLWLTPANTPPTPQWAAASGQPTPAEFLYVMFPKSEQVQLFDAPDGQVVGVLSRAVLNSEQEVRDAGWVAVVEPAATRWVHCSQLAWSTSEDRRVKLVQSLSQNFALRHPAAGRQILYSTDAASGSPTTITVRAYDDEEHYREFVYLLSADRAIPVTMSAVFGPAKSLGHGMAFVASVLIALAAPLALNVLVWTVTGFRRQLKEYPHRV